MKKPKNYSGMLQEIEQTLDRMNRGDIPIDKLEEEVRSAAEKITFLRSKLRSTQAEITRVLKDMEDDGDTGGIDEPAPDTQ